MMTPFDRYLSTGSIQFLKLFIPFLPPDNQRIIAIYVKFLEFQHTLSHFHGMRQATEFDDMFEIIKPYMSQADSDTFNQMLDAINMINMMKENPEMQDLYQPAKEGDTSERMDE